MRKAMLTGQRGFGLPFALLVILIIGLISAMLTSLTSGGARVGKSYQTSTEVFAAAEGALNVGIREIITQPNFWVRQEPIAVQPLGYTSYSPVANDSTNGIPACTGIGCERDYYPVGGGLLKNFGAFTGDGATATDAAPIAGQLEALNPEPDVVINGIPAWYQIERLDEAEITGDAVGVSLDPNAMKLQVRFRVTASARRQLRGTEGTTTVVGLIAVNPI